MYFANLFFVETIAKPKKVVEEFVLSMEYLTKEIENFQIMLFV
jgi:hypothetical protein